MGGVSKITTSPLKSPKLIISKILPSIIADVSKNIAFSIFLGFRTLFCLLNAGRRFTTVFAISSARIPTTFGEKCIVLSVFSCCVVFLAIFNLLI